MVFFCPNHEKPKCERGQPFVIGRDCRLCWNKVHNWKYRFASYPWTKDGKRKPCQFLGDEITSAKRIELGLTHAKVWRECQKGHGPQCQCNAQCGPLCDDYQPDDDADPVAVAVPAAKKIDGNWPTVGVSIGHYGMPGLIELQAKIIREQCGAVPILVSDDHTEEAFTEENPNDGLLKKARLLDIVERYGLIYQDAASERVGHAGGDLGAFYHGLNYAKKHGVDYWLKLSQRLVIDRPLYLQKLADIMQRKNSHTMSNVHKNRGKFFFSIRSECVMMDVKRWHRSDILQLLTPRGLGHAAENVVEKCVGILGGSKINCPLMTDDRSRYHKDVYWYEQPNANDAYTALAAKYDVDLGLGFHVGGSIHSPGFRWG